MDAIFAWIESSAFSTWVRESESTFAFPTFVVLHTIGMGFLVGISSAIDLRILGIARRIPLAPMERFLPVLWWALGINVVSGVVLLIAYPTKAITNPVFYVKLAGIALGLWLLRLIRIEVFRHSHAEAPASRKAAMLAIASLVVWIAAITAGRLLAYTHTWVLVGIRANY